MTEESFLPFGLRYSILCHWSISIPLKKSKKLWFSDVFRNHRKKPVACNGLMDVLMRGFHKTAFLSVKSEHIFIVFPFASAIWLSQRPFWVIAEG